MKRDDREGARERPPEGVFYGVLTVAMGLMFLCLGLALMVLTTASIIGPFQLVAPDGEARSRTLGLWLPDSVPASSPETERRVRTWRLATGGPRPVRQSRSLDSLARDGVRVVALPDARTLSRDEAAALRRYLSGGGGVILAGSVGVRNPLGEWRGFDLMQRLLGVREVKPRPASTEFDLRVDLRGPLGAALDPDERIDVRPVPGLPAVPSASAELRWPPAASLGGTGSLRGASLRVDLGAGRLVWLAVGPDGMSRRLGPLGNNEVTHLFDAAIAWASREPFPEILPWPDARSFAGARASAENSADAVVVTGGEGAGDPFAVLDREIAEAERRGGLFFYFLPRDPLPQELRRELAAYADAQLGKRGAWIATPGELASWKRQREDVFVSFGSVGPRRGLLEVENRNADAVRGVVVRIHLNRRVAAVEVQRTTLQQEAPVTELDLSLGRVDIRVPDLPARARLSYTLDFTFTDEERMADAARALTQRRRLADTHTGRTRSRI